MHSSPTIRVPVSLLFEVDSLFYQEFILDLKQTRSLSTLIVDLLRVYYENGDVKAILDVVLTTNTPTSKLQEQLDRIRLEHSKNLMTTTILSQLTDQVAETVVSSSESFSGVEPTEEETSAAVTNAVPLLQGSSEVETINPTASSEDLTAVSNRLALLEQSLPLIDSKLNLLMERLLGSETSSSGVSPQLIPSTSSSEGLISTVIDTLQEDTVTDNSLVVSEDASSVFNTDKNSPPYDLTDDGMKASESEVAFSTESPSVSGVSPDSTGNTSPSLLLILDDDEVTESSEQEKTNRPSSFGVVFGSIAKKKSPQ